MITANGSDLRAAKQRFRSLPRDLQNDLRKYQRSESTPIWRESMRAKTGVTKFAERTFRTGNRVKAGAVITLVAGGSNRRMSGGATAAQLIRAAEFGSNRRDSYTRYNRTSPNGKRHTVTRRTSRQLPTFRRTGYAVYPASKLAIKRIASLQVQTVTRRLHEAIEG